MKRYPLGQLVALTLLTLLAGATFLAVFRPEDVVLVLAVAAVMPPLVSLMFRVRRRPHLALVTLANILLAVFLAGPLVFSDTLLARVAPSTATLRAIGGAARNGWAEILSSTTPVPARPAALFVPFALVWLASFVGAEMTFRSRRVILVLAPSVVLATAGILFSDHASGTWGIGAYAFVIVAAAVLATRASSFATDDRAFDERDENRRANGDAESLDTQRSVSRALVWHRLAMAIPFMVVIALVAVPLARTLPFVPARDQVSLRDHYEIPVENQSRVNPLGRIAASVQDRDVRFRLIVDQALHRSAVSGTPKLRTAVLDTYDGTQWSSGADYVTTGGSLPLLGDAAAGARSVTQTISIVKPDGPWLPALPQPVALDAPADSRIQVDPRTGAMVAPEGSTRGVAYRVRSELLDITAADFQMAEIATSDSARAATSTIDELPPGLAAIQEMATKGSASQAQQLSRLLAYFRNGKTNEGDQFKLDPDAPAGFALGNLEAFVAGKRAGRPEEFAATFAAVARSMGFPTRVAVGYQLQDEVVANTPIDVSGTDETAWPEIELKGFGWVAFDPVPTDTATSELTLEEQQLDAAIQESVDQSANNPEQPPGTNPNLGPAPSTGEAGDGSNADQLLMVCGTASLILAALLVAPWIRKRRRRTRRRHAQNAAEKAEGAWQEILDRLVEAGTPEPENLTPSEVVHVAGTQFGDDVRRPVANVGVLVNQALHSHDEPSDVLAEEVWAMTDDFDRAVRSGRTRRERVRAGLDRRPLAASRRG